MFIDSPDLPEKLDFSDVIYGVDTVFHPICINIVIKLNYLHSSVILSSVVFFTGFFGKY